MKIGSIKKILAVALVLVACSTFHALAEESGEQRYPFGIVPKEMKGITMRDGDKLHDFHVEKLEAMGKDCTACHINDDYESFLGTNAVEGQKAKTAYVHKNCVSCHIEMGGPQITSCRSCHTDAYAQ